MVSLCKKGLDVVPRRDVCRQDREGSSPSLAPLRLLCSSVPVVGDVASRREVVLVMGGLCRIRRIWPSWRACVSDLQAFHQQC